MTGSPLPGILEILQSPTELANLIQQGGIRRQTSKLFQKHLSRHPLPREILAVLLALVIHGETITPYAASSTSPRPGNIRRTSPPTRSRPRRSSKIE